MTYQPSGTGYPSAYGKQPYFGTGAPAGYVPPYSTQPPVSPYAPPPTGAFAPGTGTVPSGPQIPGMLPLEQSYIENIFRLNRGKLAHVYALFDTGTETSMFKEFTGIIEAAGRDHLILSEPETGRRVLLPMVYFGYATFDEELEYTYPFAGQMQGVATYSPR